MRNHYLIMAINRHGYHVRFETYAYTKEEAEKDITNLWGGLTDVIVFDWDVQSRRPAWENPEIKRLMEGA